MSNTRMVLVTGGAGFIGSHLCEAFLHESMRVRGLDDFSSGNAGNLAHVWNAFDVVEGSIIRPPLSRARSKASGRDRASSGAFSVAESSVRRISRRINVGGMATLVAARRAQISRESSLPRVQARMAITTKHRTMRR
jgi:nucleoside-diphosphate-sugar epimerase